MHFLLSTTSQFSGGEREEGDFCLVVCLSNYLAIKEGSHPTCPQMESRVRLHQLVPENSFDTWNASWACDNPEDRVVDKEESLSL